MSCPARLISRILAVAVFGLGFLCAPPARANFLATGLTAPHASATTTPFQAYYREPLAFDQAAEGEGTGADNADHAPAGWPEILLRYDRAPLPGPGCLPYSSPAGAGSSGGGGSVPGGGFVAAGLPAEFLLLGIDLTGYLALEETLRVPWAFHPPLFHPPRRER
jgi:hypothetical protein